MPASAPELRTRPRTAVRVLAIAEVVRDRRPHPPDYLGRQAVRPPRPRSVAADPPGRPAARLAVASPRFAAAARAAVRHVPKGAGAVCCRFRCWQPPCRSAPATSSGRSSRPQMSRASSRTTSRGPPRSSTHCRWSSCSGSRTPGLADARRSRRPRCSRSSTPPIRACSILTFLGGLLWCSTFRRHPNLFAVALGHAVLAVVVDVDAAAGGDRGLQDRARLRAMNLRI